MRFLPEGSYEVKVEIDDSYLVGDRIYVTHHWASKTEPGSTIDVTYADDTLFWIEYRTGGKLHRLEGPASIVFEPDGSISEQTFAIDGVPIDPHTDTNPRFEL